MEIEKRSTTVTGKINFNTFQELNAYIEQHPGKSKSAIVGEAVSRFLNPGESAGDPAILEQLANLQDENQKLKAQIQENTPDTAQIDSLTAENETLRQQIEDLQNRPPEIKEIEVIKEVPTGAKLSENQIIVNIPDTLKPFLVEVSNRETNRTGKRITPEIILLELFWKQVSQGPGDHLPLTFRQSEIKNILNNVKKQAANE